MEFTLDGHCHHPLMYFSTLCSPQKGDADAKRVKVFSNNMYFTKSGRQEQMPFAGNGKLAEHLQLTRTDKSIYLVINKPVRDRVSCLLYTPLGAWASSF